ncbi:hypothetical protein AMELA_G00061280 [Ameiurus melas]|uniref:Ubiquitin-like domain-containing protein n=1 Tax=Ameiurus melas TaxID=219545 RepID=A0A7J6B259_AMEME|nr:hypothetical protein AMELA_G00061280 [Ameiurus melas]
MGGIFSYFFGETHPTPEESLQQTEDSSPVANISQNQEKEKSDRPYISPENTPGDTPRTESIFPTTCGSDHIEDADKTYIQTHPTPEESLQQTEDSSPVANISQNQEKEKSDHPYIPPENTPGDTPRTERIFPTTCESDHIEDADKIDIQVVYAGKQIEIMIFPLEKISYLLQQACGQVHKKPENMTLIFEGEKLDLMKTMSQYPKLRRGTKVHLIRAA